MAGPHVETAVISYRVADFLKRHPPFNAIDDDDLLELAARGRVRFYEPNQYILWQGEPHRLQLFVIQQGTVSLWDEAGETPGFATCAEPATCSVSSATTTRRIVCARFAPKATWSCMHFPQDDFDACVMNTRRPRSMWPPRAASLRIITPTGENAHRSRRFSITWSAHARRTCRRADQHREAARQILDLRQTRSPSLMRRSASRGVVTIDSLAQLDRARRR